MDPMELAGALSQIPLFRELQRLLMAQTGPVNWEIAGQIGQAVSQMGGPGPLPSRGDFSAYEEACRLAELQVSQLTGMEPPGSITRIELVDRTAWANANLDALRPLVNRLAKGLQGSLGSELGSQLGSQLGDQFGAEAAAGMQMGAVFGVLGPLILGLEMGFLVGFLSRQVLGQYDLCLPRGDLGRVWFVEPNIAELRAELELDSRQFQMYLALHEVTHQLQFSAMPWVREHFTAKVERFIDAAEIDPSEAVSRLQSLGDPEQLSRLLSHPEELLPMLVTPAQQGLASEIETLMAVIEGYVDWIMEQIASDMLTEFGKIREGLNRRRVERSSVDRLLEGLLGIDLKPAQYRLGGRFVQAVAAAGALPKLWQSPASLPSPLELAEPTKWLARVAFS
jgi:putative hydrolase